MSSYHHRRVLAYAFTCFICTVGTLSLQQSLKNTLHAEETLSFRPTESADFAIASSVSFEDPPAIESVNGVLNAKLHVEYATNTIDVFDESTGARKPVQVHLRSYNKKLVGPTLIAKPGDVLKIELINSLPAEQQSSGHDGHDPINPGITPHGFNTTNLHTHGLHVSPSGNSDNVLLQIPPNGRLEYEIRIPEDHPSGSFWYHAHKHGSTAMQVSSGMAGLIVIKGGIDSVNEIAKATEHVFVFQQIPFVIDSKGIGRVESFRDSFGRGTWDKLQRFTTINGVVLPVIKMRPGEVQRWRFVHSGNRESIKVKLAGHVLEQVAFDGLAAGMRIPAQTVELHPGYRVDVLVKASSTSGEYLISDERIEANANSSGADKARKYLGKVIVEGEAMEMDLPGDIALGKHVPFSPILDNEVTGFQTSLFTTDLRAFRRLKQDFRFLINYRSFDPENAARKLRLGDVDEWTIGSRTIDPDPSPLKAGHVFHIHVNPFEITSIVDESGKSVPIEAKWKDTIFLRDGYTYTVRTRYRRYVGTFMQHCHMLEHEDQGMMELIEIIPGVSHGVHHH